MTDTTDKLIIQSETQGVQQSTDQVNQLGKAMDGVTVSATNVERSTGSVDSKFAGLERRFQTTAGNAAQLAKVQAAVAAAVAQNSDLQDRGNEILEAATAKYGAAAVAAEELTKAHGGLDTQSQALLHSLRSTAEQLASGVPITQALSNQINHLTYAASGEGGLSGAFNSVIGIFSRFLTPMNLIGGGAAALAAGALYLGTNWGAAAAEIDHALTGIGAKSGTTAQDIANFTKQNSSAAGLSVSEARNAALEFAKTGEITLAGLKGVGDAIKGYSILTGKDATDSTKAFAGALSGDLVKGILTLNERYGALDAKTIEYIQSLAEAGDKTRALQVFVDASAQANKRAEDSVGGLASAWQSFKNIASAITSGPAVGDSLAQQLSTVQRQLDDARQAASSGSGISRNSRGELVSVNDSLLGEKELEQETKTLQTALDSLNAEQANRQLTILSGSAKQISDSFLPQIAAIRQLNEAINTMQQAKNAGVGGSTNDDALVVARQQAQLQQESLDKIVGQAVAVQNLQTKWGFVSTQTATTLESLQGQLNVAQQITGAAQMVAQADATINSLLQQGLSLTEATQIATDQLAVSQANATSAVEKQVQSLQDQTAMIKAQGTGAEARTAATIAYNNAIKSGASEESAAALASATLAKYNAQAAKEAERLQNAANGAAGAYARINESIGSTIVNGQALLNGGGGDVTPANNSSEGSFSTDGKQFTSTTPAGFAAADLKFKAEQAIKAFNDQGGFPQLSNINAANINAALSGSGIDAAIAAAKNEQLSAQYQSPGVGQLAVQTLATKGGVDPTFFDSVTQKYSNQTVDFNSQFQAIDALYQLKNAQTTDKGSQIANLQDELAWLQTQPVNVQQQQALVQVTNALKDLTKSTDNLNATNQDLLSPYYSQDPRTSHIGFRTQGMASTGEFTVPGGYSASDNMLGMIPLASGEIVNVRRPGQPVGGSGSGSAPMITINMPTAFYGNVDRAEFGRTAFQNVMAAARQIGGVVQ